ncbi:sensor histidine kinase [Niastella vici]|nr:histidine kinase [Niastella vici]
MWELHLKYSLLITIGYTYLVVYFLLPRFVAQKKYALFGILLFFFTGLFYTLYVLNFFRIKNEQEPSTDNQILMTWYFSMNFIINGPPVACAIFLALKMLKTYYIKIEEKQLLVKENTQAELQLLKAQVHPHFLFNTLNNIYSFSLTQPSHAGTLVLQLSNTLRYMINDCAAVRVSLEKEIQLINNYIGLESVRYGNRLTMQTSIKGDYEHKMIAPLLMLPFVENSFKHGIGMMRGPQWINLELLIQDNRLYFTISNSKPLQPAPTNGNEGIGLINVQKRLQLLYPQQHELKIESTESIFTVYMQVALQEQSVPVETGNPNVHAQLLPYA